MTDNMLKSVRLMPNEVLDSIYVGFSWFEEERESHSIVHDINLSALVLNMEDVVDCEEDFVFYNNFVDSAHLVTYNAIMPNNEIIDDNIMFKLNNAKDSTKRILVFANIHDAACRRQHFAQLHFFHMFTSFEPWRIEPFSFTNLPAAEVMVLCEFIKVNSSWLFRPIGTGFEGDFLSFLRVYIPHL